MNQVVNARLYDYDVSAIAVMHIHGKIELNQVGRNENGSYLWSDSDGLTEYLKKQVVDEALLSLPTMRREKLNDLIRRLEALGIVVHVTVNTFGMAEKEKAIENFGSYRVLTYSPRIFEPAELFLKRLMDIAGGLVGIIFTCILSIFVVPAIYLESPGPVIFKQTRIGRNGRRFSIYKFRSMYMDAEERKKELMAQNQMDGLMFKMKDDPRITKVGKFIRKTSIDEFPQFFNVLKGDMSLVGTRPPTLDEFMQYEEHHKRRLSLKPGITGMWQVSGRSEIQNFEDVVKLDLEYIDKPMIYYPMSVLMNAGIRDILIISTPQDTPRFENLLGDGHQFGVNLTYAVQPSPDGLAQAFIIGADFIGDDSVAMVLGDNIFAGHGLKKRLTAAVENAESGKGAI